MNRFAVFGNPIDHSLSPMIHNEFSKELGIELSYENMRQLFIPSGFAHGFVVLSETAKINYKVDNYYSLECDRGIAFNDPDLKINWLLTEADLKLSNKPYAPTVEDLHKNGRNFPPNFLHESWMDYLYWDIELEP